MSWFVNITGFGMPGGLHCYVKGCRSEWRDRMWSLHRIPRNYYVGNIWIERINRPAPSSGSWANVRICSRHFIDGRPTKQNPHPTLYMNECEYETVSTKEVQSSRMVYGLVDNCKSGDHTQNGRPITRDEENVIGALLDLAMTPGAIQAAEASCNNFECGNSGKCLMDFLAL